jgi:hypothetical protein
MKERKNGGVKRDSVDFKNFGLQIYPVALSSSRLILDPGTGARQAPTSFPMFGPVSFLSSR